MRHLRIVLSAAIIALFGSSLLAQPQKSTYYMNGVSAALPVDQSATNTGPLSVNATNFVATPGGTGITPGTDLNVGPNPANNAALQYNTTDNLVFTFSITNTAAPGPGALAWDISGFDFDILTSIGVSGNYTLKVDRGSGFFTAGSGTIASAGTLNWRSIGGTISPTSFQLNPGETANFEYDFTGFNPTVGGNTYSIDSVDITGRALVAVPEPASLAAIGFTGTLLTCGLYARNRRKTKLKRKTRSKQTNAIPVLAR